MPLQLNGIESGKLESILLRAFDADRFRRILRHKLNLQVYDFVALNASWEQMVYETVERINQDYAVDRLIAAAREANPNNPVLHEFAEQYRLTSVNPSDVPQELERIITNTINFLNPAPWREKLAAIETKVCRIEIESNLGEINGTGFLIGTSLVLTNYHVIEPVIKGEKEETTADGYSAVSGDVICRFDYKRIGTTTFNGGIAYRLAADWVVDASPNSPLDQLPPSDCLDYALLRLEGTPGKDFVDNMDAATGTMRGWIELPANAYNYPIDSPVFIMQHPKGSPLKLAFDSRGVILLNENKTRIRHRVNTENGSSGSPCFSQNLDLIALHHSGDPDFDPAHKPTYNEAIPIMAIIDLMRSRGIFPQLNV